METKPFVAVVVRKQMNEKHNEKCPPGQKKWKTAKRREFFLFFLTLARVLMAPADLE
jgi:hypothetical protein